MQLNKLLNLQVLGYSLSVITNWVAQTLFFALVHAAILTPLWNIVLPDLCSVIKPIAFTQAVGLILIVRILTRSWMQEGTVQYLGIINDQMSQLNGISYNILVALSILIPEAQSDEAKSAAKNEQPKSDSQP